ncbi:hypothetical protein D3C83_85330 [compost metagenome]
MALEHAFRFEQRVDLRHRHRIDRVLQRELADRRQLGAGRQLPARRHAPDLVEELPVDRHARVRFQDEHFSNYCLSALVQ